MLWLLFFLVTAIHAELCQPGAENAFKVRLSIRTALGDKAYAWDTNEEYLFKAMVAFSMRKVPNREATEKNKEPSEVDDAEDKCENMITIENGIPSDPLDMKGGHINDAFMTEDERLTPL
ncbi:collectrin isoform X1 [Homo sapiens]|uniref:collectrin isoform X1 n=1 Tax=Homo sapiens TaxID=9606 RepID=UPI0007DC56C9|nr:collectrin isoform X1 [Homo sapiens]XP_054183409.1 collectrin isoform X1 [Homo sapiens]|eukprot:XP_016885170.1 collectrin isoform X2 [Homo sapiens]